MDPISIITLCASATATAYHVSATLYSFINSARNIDAEVEALAREITGVRRVLDAIGVVFTNPVIKSDKAVSIENGPIWAAVAGALNDCRISMERFDAQLSGNTKRAAGNNFFKQSFKWMKLSFKLEDIGKARFQMSTHTNNLQIALQMVTILVATTGPGKASIDVVSEDYEKLQQSMSQLSMAEEKLSSEDRADLQKRTDYLKRTATAVLFSLDKAPTITLDKQDQQMSRERLRNIVTEFNRSLYDSSEVDDTPNDPPPDYETVSNGEPNIELDLAQTLFNQGEQYYGKKQYRLAETVMREGFQHLRTLDQGGEDVDAVRHQLLLIKSCMWQDKWQEAELMLMVLVKAGRGLGGHAAILEAYHLLSQTHLCQYDFESALDYCRQALTGRVGNYGKRHRLVASSMQLLGLIHRANGDSTSGLAYEKTIPEEYLHQPENDIVMSRFSGYSTNEHVRTTLREKGMAIRELLKKGFLKGTQTLASNENAWTGNMADPIAFHPANVDLDLGSALFWAADTDMEYLVRWLLSRGADPNTCIRGCPAVLLAGSEAHSEVMRTMVLAGADVNASDNNERTILLWASLKGHSETARILIELGVDIDKADDGASTPLMDATYKGHDATVRLLLQNGASVELVSKKLWTALHYAADNSQLECCRALLKHGARTDARNEYGKTPLLIAAEQRDEAICQLLIEAGSDVNAGDNQGWTVLRKCASYSYKLDTLRLLLERGADVDACPLDDCTALLACVDSDRVGHMALLLEHGADPSKLRYGENAMQIARRRQNKAVIELLTKYGAPEETTGPWNREKFTGSRPGGS